MSWPPRASDYRQGAYTESEIYLLNEMRKVKMPFTSQKWLAVPAEELDSKNRIQRAGVVYYVVDFIVGTKTIVEVDGSIHDKSRRRDRDAERDRRLQTQGYTVLRFTNRDLVDDLDRVLGAIWEAYRQNG